MGGLRLLLACLVLVPVLLLVERGLPRLSGRDLAVLALEAFTGIFVFTALLLYGLTLTGAAGAGIVTSTTPAVAGALSVLLLGERLTRARAGGIALAVLGILAINVGAPGASGAEEANPVLGNLLVFGAVVGAALFVVCGKVAAARVVPLTAAATITVLAFVLWARGLADRPAGAGARLVAKLRA